MEEAERELRAVTGHGVRIYLKRSLDEAFGVRRLAVSFICKSTSFSKPIEKY